MSRTPAPDGEPRTRTVSVTVTPAEAEAIVAAAENAHTTKSAWLVARVVQSLTSGQRRGAVQAAVRAIEGDGTPRGARTARVSAVMQVHDHDELKAAAASLGLAVHAYVQAVAITASKAELSSVPAAQRRVVEHEKAASKSGHSILVTVPVEFAKADVAMLGEFLHRLVVATAVHILDGNGRKIAEGASRLAAKVKASPTTALRLAVPEFEVMAAAHVLGIPAADYATALATRAARAMEGV